MKYLLAALLIISTSALARDPAQVREFRRHTICPSTGKATMKCSGYVVDHIRALACGGADNWRTNMQYQTIADGKAKDKWERKGCIERRKVAR